MVSQNCSVSHILQNIFLCVQQSKDIHTGLELLEGDLMMTEFSFLGELSGSALRNGLNLLHVIVQDWSAFTRNFTFSYCSKSGSHQILKAKIHILLQRTDM